MSPGQGKEMHVPLLATGRRGIGESSFRPVEFAVELVGQGCDVEDHRAQTLRPIDQVWQVLFLQVRQNSLVETEGSRDIEMVEGQAHAHDGHFDQRSPKVEVELGRALLFGKQRVHLDTQRLFDGL
jgi:hypothetical protein